MNRLLHIIASPRGLLSRTLALSRAFFDELISRYPGLIIDELNVFTENLPEIVEETVEGKYILLGGKPIPPELNNQWKQIEAFINRFMVADTIVLSTPMWNFGMPYKLKQLFDGIIQPRYLFRYTADGVEGMAKGKKVFVFSSRGGDYSSGSPAAAMDHLEPHLRTIFRFIGITDLTFLNAQPMDAVSEEQSKSNLLVAIERAKNIL